MYLTLVYVQFKKINPQQVVPVIEHDGEKITESATIARYLFDVFEGVEKLLPRSDLKQRARVDSYLDWCNTTARPNLIGAVMKLKINPKLGEPEPTEEETKTHMENAYKIVSEINDQVAEAGGFLTGDHMSIADVQIYNICSLSRPVLELDTAKYEAFDKWMAAIAQDEVIQELDAGMLKRLEDQS